METQRSSEQTLIGSDDRAGEDLDRVSSLQRLVCELLVKNQKLRMEVKAASPQTDLSPTSVSVYK
jgi:hypothetical protein